jgi:hypothetical protein
MRRTATAVPNSIENVPFFDSFKVAKVLRKRLPNILTWFKHRISNSRIQQQASTAGFSQSNPTLAVSENSTTTGQEFCSSVEDFNSKTNSASH